MESKFQKFLRFQKDQELKTSNPIMKKVVDSYTFLEISEKNESELNSKISDNFKESKVIIINHYKEEDIYFVVSFKRTILVINETKINILQSFLTKKNKLEICFLSNTKEIFDDINDKFNEMKITYDHKKNDKNFENDIIEINSNFFNKKPQNFPFNNILQILKSSISGYLIKQSYYVSDRIESFNDQIKPRKINENEIIKLRTFGTGSLFNSILYYHIEYEKLVIVKKENSYDSEIIKLLNREIQNYEKISHPFIPKFYGIIEFNDNNYPVIEFINGETLANIDLKKFSETEIYEIILQMILVFHYLHNQHFIYRDLKPDNAMIDENKTFVLIDYDRMVKDDYKYNENEKTADFPTQFAAPEILSCITNKCDIYSIGKMIDYIMNEAKTVIKNYKNTKLFQISNKCIDLVELRPSSSDLMKDLISLIKKNIDKNFKKAFIYFLISANQNLPEAQYYLGLIYFENKYVSRDINKSIHYYSLAANQNYPQAQYNLGVIYYEGKYVSRDINKSIHYYSLAANQNNLQAQFNLGLIYFENKYISRDINKSIYYFSLAADQNDQEAQYNLGLIYYEGKYITRNINKSLYYFSLAANQNNLQAQYNLGVIYYEGKYVSRDINKSIHYYSLAADQNHTQSQYNLGVIYYLGLYISRDINKSLYYFSLAADQNFSQAQFILGLIYYENKYVSRDINKSIHYYSLAADQNHPLAQYNLGIPLTYE